MNERAKEPPVVSEHTPAQKPEPPITLLLFSLPSPEGLIGPPLGANAAAPIKTN